MGAAPKDSLITRGTNWQTNLTLFHCFSDFGVKKPEEDAAEGLPGDNLEGGFRLSLGTVWVLKAQTFPME